MAQTAVLTTDDVFPAWSADTRITFSSDRAESGKLDVYVMNADGSGVILQLPITGG